MIFSYLYSRIVVGFVNEFVMKFQKQNKKRGNNACPLLVSTGIWIGWFEFIDSVHRNLVPYLFWSFFSSFVISDNLDCLTRKIDEFLQRIIP